MKEILSIKPISLELNESNDMYMTLNIGILSNAVNYNNAQFTDGFIDYIISNKNTYIGLPLQVNKEKLENEEYDELTHELVGGELLTDSVGTYVDYWDEIKDDGVRVLMGSVRIWKRYPKTCEAILELYNNGELESSCEVLVKEYKEINEDGVRVIDHANGINSFIGSAIVSNPAEIRAKATLLVAEAYQSDLNDIQKGGNGMSKKFNKGNEIKVNFELNELSFDDIRQQIYNLINPINPTTEERSYKYWIRELFQTYLVVEEWDNSNELYKINYSLENESVVISPDWQKVEITYQVVGTDINGELHKLQKELNTAKEELLVMEKTNEEKVVELQNSITELEAKIAELNATIVAQEETKSALEGKVEELNSTVAELSTYKDQVEKAEKEAKVSEVTEKYSKLLSEEVFKSEEAQEAIRELNTQKLNELVVNEIAKSKVEVNDTANTKDVVVNARTSEDLVKTSILEKYGIKK